MLPSIIKIHQNLHKRPYIDFLYYACEFPLASGSGLGIAILHVQTCTTMCIITGMQELHTCVVDAYYNHNKCIVTIRKFCKRVICSISVIICTTTKTLNSPFFLREKVFSLLSTIVLNNRDRYRIYGFTKMCTLRNNPSKIRTHKIKYNSIGTTITML